MKKILLFVLAAIAITACKDSKSDEKAILADVIKLHDTVMAHSDQLMHDKMKLDTLLKTADDTTKSKIKTLIAGLNNADSQMEDWMQKFDPEQKNKSHDYIMNYLTAQKIRIQAVDSMINASVKASGEYLKHLKK